METVKSLLDANKRFAEGFDKGEPQLPPNKPVAVLTCIDARLHPTEFLGLEIGDAHVLRNAGGRATDDALRSLIILGRADQGAPREPRRAAPWSKNQRDGRTGRRVVRATLRPPRGI